MKEQLQAVHNVLGALIEILSREGVLGRFPDLVLARSLTEKAMADPRTVPELKSVIGSMYGASGTFQDYVIHRDSFQEKRALNEQLDGLREQLHDLVPQL
jgi:hypothetical protein